MKVVKKKLSEIYPAEMNVRQHPKKQVEELARSLEKFGQYRPLVVTADGEILVGNGLYEALRATGSETADVIVLPENIDDDYKMKLMLADNKTFELGSANLENIDLFMQSISDFDIPGFDTETLEELYMDIETSDFEISDISGMGKVPQERIDKIKATEERREENPDWQSVKVDENEVSAYEPTPIQPNAEDEEQTEVRRYVNCPHCGAKIWL